MKSLIGMTDEEFQRARKFPDYTVKPSWKIMQYEPEHWGQIMAI